VATADVFYDKDEKTVYFPCEQEEIGGIYFKTKTRKKGKTKEEEKSVSFTGYLGELKRIKCEKIMFQGGFEMEV